MSPRIRRTWPENTHARASVAVWRNWLAIRWASAAAPDSVVHVKPREDRVHWFDSASGKRLAS